MCLQKARSSPHSLPFCFLLEDAIQVPIGGAVEDGFQAIAFMAGRDDGFPTTIALNPIPVCLTIYEDDNEEHMVIEIAKKTHRPVTTNLAECLRATTRD